MALVFPFKSKLFSEVGYMVLVLRRWRLIYFFSIHEYGHIESFALYLLDYLSLV